MDQMLKGVVNYERENVSLYNPVDCFVIRFIEDIL